MALAGTGSGMQLSIVRFRRLLTAALLVHLVACSSGEAVVVVPQFDEATPVEDVQTALEDAGLVVEVVQALCNRDRVSAADAGCTPGFVSTNPVAGAEVERGSTVEVAYFGD